MDNNILLAKQKVMVSDSKYVENNSSVNNNTFFFLHTICCQEVLFKFCVRFLIF